VQISSSLTDILTPTAIALGNFDGVHRGHLEVIGAMLNRAPEMGIKTVVTFDPHPQEYFTGESRQLLTPPAERAAILASLGVEQLVLLPFDRQLVALSPSAFVDRILVGKLQAKFVSVGADFRFGNQRAGNTADLEILSRNSGMTTYIAPLELSGDKRVSSSQIRAALLAADLPATRDLLGRDYSIVGVVVPGQQIGRSIGFPTANLQYPPEKFLPRQGVYCVTVDTAAESGLPAVMNIGKRPTVDGTKMSAEVHLLAWQGDLYGQTLTLTLQKFLRSEQKFPSLDALTSQIKADCTAAQSFFGLAEI
jgi:riboflavin kinase / FMN adenylyltransferase